MSGRRIGVFDSGVGGLTVAGRLMAECPAISLHYYGDTAHVPYGQRPEAQVRQLIESAIGYLVDQGVAAIVMACNTSNALCLPQLRQHCPVPLIGIIEPAAQAAVLKTRNGRIGVVANPVTARSLAHQQACLQSGQQCQFPIEVFTQACPDLVPLIEAGQVSGPGVAAVVRGYLAPLQAQGIDTLILGCTHYPFLQPLIQQILGPQVEIIDPAAYVWQELQHLGICQVMSPSPPHRFEVSGSPREFARVGQQLLAQPLPVAVRPCQADWAGLTH